MHTQFIKDDIKQAINHLNRAYDFVDSDPKRCAQNILIVKSIMDAVKDELLPIQKQLDPPGEPSPTP